MHKLLALVAAAAAVLCDAGAAAAAAARTPLHREFLGSLEKHTCDHVHENERANLMVESSCGRPRDVFVELKPEGGHILLLPSAVWVKRCVGVCTHNRQQCTATKKRKRHVPVRYVDVGTGEEACGTYLVEEHVHCGCGCPLNDAICRAGGGAQHFNRQVRRQSLEAEVEPI